MKIINQAKKVFLTSSVVFLLPLLASASGTELKDPLQLGEDALPTLAGRFIQTALGISGVLALIAFIYGGILYMLAGVDPKNVDKGKGLMKYAVIGLVIIFASYAVVNFLLKDVLQVPTTSGADDKSTWFQ